MNYVVHLFKDADMRCQHEGLKDIAAAGKVRVDDLDPGEHVVFINKAADRIKLYSHGHVLSYYKSPKGKLNLHIVEMIPRCMGGHGKIDWGKADKLALDKLLAKRGIK